jgi:hypothetical protein
LPYRSSNGGTHLIENIGTTFWLFWIKETVLMLNGGGISFSTCAVAEMMIAVLFLKKNEA